MMKYALPTTASLPVAPLSFSVNMFNKKILLLCKLGVKMHNISKSLVYYELSRLFHLRVCCLCFPT